MGRGKKGGAGIHACHATDEDHVNPNAASP